MNRIEHVAFISETFALFAMREGLGVMSGEPKQDHPIWQGQQGVVGEALPVVFPLDSQGFGAWIILMNFV